MAESGDDVGTRGCRDTQPVIVLIGASAGGVQALQSFVGALPERTGAALVVAAHLDPTHHSEMPRIIAPQVVGRACPASRDNGSRREQRSVHHRALEQVAPFSMLVDESLRVMHLSENAGRFVMPSGGPLSGDAVDLVRPELRWRSALYRACEQTLPTLSVPVLLRLNGARASSRSDGQARAGKRFRTARRRHDVHRRRGGGRNGYFRGRGL